MSRIQIWVLIGALVAIHLTMALLLNPSGLAASSGPIETRATLACIGVLIAQPALLSIWAALGPQTSLRRWVQVLALLACLTLANEFAQVNNAQRAGEAGEIMQPLQWGAAVLVCLLPLWVLRRKLRWRIRPPAGLSRQVDDGEHQFSMRGLLTAMAALAAFLAALRWLHPMSNLTAWPEHLLRYFALGATMAVPGMLVILIFWLLVADGPSTRWRWSFALFGLVVLVTVAAAVAGFGSPGEVGELIFVVLGIMLCAAGTSLVVRMCGYRLVRTAAHSETETDDAVAPLPTEAASQRFVLTGAAMGLLVAALAMTVPHRLSVWREMAEQRGWAASGLLASLVEGQVVRLRAFDGVSTRISPATIAQINACEHLQQLALCGSTVTDDTLELLVGLPSLTKLSLFGARITDEGVRHLGEFRSLRDLDLRMTDVTDDGLIALAGLRELVALDLGHTRVTPEGLAWLNERRPDLTASAITNDVTTGQIAQFFRPRQTRLSQAAPGPATLRVRAAGPGVTDSGVAALRGMTSIVDLDLTDARVTDAAVNDLSTLSGLKELVLRDTGITKAGIDSLRQKLPECEIAP
ncbi:MAG TPA: hypothetical protein VG826_31920 [Pirellulales bacterium]|nr:hypothetical protein [Pirellulales bacterium]